MRSGIVVGFHVVVFLVIRIVTGRSLVEIEIGFFSGGFVLSVAIAVGFITSGGARRRLELGYEGVAVEVGRAFAVVRNVESAWGRGEIHRQGGPCHIDLPRPIDS